MDDYPALHAGDGKGSNGAPPQERAQLARASVKVGLRRAPSGLSQLP